MAEQYDIAVLGAGPAGANAALEATKLGSRVVMIDEQPQAGGQVWRAKSAAIISAPKTPETSAGNQLRGAVRESDIAHLGDARVWQIEQVPEGWSLHLLVDGRSETITAKALALATGAREFVQPIPGWTLPGVIGLAGATALMKQALMPPGHCTVVAGSGPLVFFVASEIRRLGGKVAAVVTPNSRSDWMRSLPSMCRRPDLMWRGMVWIADLMLARVPIFWRHAVSEVRGEAAVSSVHISQLGPDWTPVRTVKTITADSVCLGNGLIPALEAAQLAGIEITHEPKLGGWIPRAAEDGSTKVRGVFICGDGAGIRGASAAEIHGKLAGLSAAEFTGKKVGLQKKRLHRSYAGASRFGLAMTALSVPRPGLEKLTTPQTIMCRCESLSRDQLLLEIQAGASSTNAVKSGLRAGMGPCGGKFCQTAIARLVASTQGLEDGDVPPHTARPPLRPVPVSALAGDFAYSDLPIPKPAPL
uniref:FAD-dependent oxidoreductase n=1 Tax=Pararhizobium sp. IMCC3301 TaxID=3067904 RepID=UPI002742712A|nr:FAD-dependent oxidoreductase [Pararhizobium sp. IMCC3301]